MVNSRHYYYSLLTSIGDDITVGTFVLLQREPGQVEAGHDLDRVLVLPLVDEVVFRPAVWKKSGKFERLVNTQGSR